MGRRGEVISVRPVFMSGARIEGVVAVRIVGAGAEVELEFDARSCALLNIGIHTYLKPFHSNGSVGTLSDEPLRPIASS
jgi:hypothetical protein